MTDKIGDMISLKSINLESLQKRAEGISLKGKTSSDAEITKAATDFEAMLVKQMMSSMWSTVPQNGMLSGGREEEFYRDMLSDAVSEQVSEGQGIGIKDVIFRELKTRQDKIKKT